MDFIIDVATCHITDLSTLQFLLQPPSSPTTEAWTVSFKRIQVLSITLRLSLQTFRIFEQENLNDNTSAPTWLTLSPTIPTKLPNLRTLSIWADHTSPKKMVPRQRTHIPASPFPTLRIKKSSYRRQSPETAPALRRSGATLHAHYPATAIHDYT